MNSSFFIYCTYTKDCGAQEMPYSPRLLGILNFFTMDDRLSEAGFSLSKLIQEAGRQKLELINAR